MRIQKASGGGIVLEHGLDVVEYYDFRKPVHDVVFGLPGDMGKGAAIWEPLGWRSGLFDRKGNVTGQMSVYDSLNARYLHAARVSP